MVACLRCGQIHGSACAVGRHMGLPLQPPFPLLSGLFWMVLTLEIWGFFRFCCGGVFNVFLLGVFFGSVVETHSMRLYLCFIVGFDTPDFPLGQSPPLLEGMVSWFCIGFLFFETRCCFFIVLLWFYSPAKLRDYSTTADKITALQHRKTTTLQQEKTTAPSTKNHSTKH